MHIELRNVTRRYGRVRALDGASLQLAPGQLVGILGLNGAGKTTLLRCLGGVVAPDQGQLLFDGRPFSRADIGTRRRFFFLPDFPMLFWDRSVSYNLSVILRLYGREGGDAPARSIEVLRNLDLLPVAGTAVAKLSRGQVYKVALAALFLVDPEVWLLDEPLASGIDPLAVSLFKRMARDAAARGCTVVYSTQMLDIAERFADRVIVLHEGRVRAFAAIEELRAAAPGSEAPLEALFLKLRSQQA